MEIEIKKITENIYLLIFDNQFDITSTLLRFQEYYESPYFRGKIFTLTEFKRWYIQNSRKGIESGKFTYNHDWSGFNIPSYVLKLFYDGKFNPLSVKEKKVLSLLKNVKEPYYVIGVHRKMYHLHSLLKHETAHGLFYTEKGYKKEVLNLLKKFETESIKQIIQSNEAGYHEAVMNDEVHAYILASDIKPKTQEHKLMKKVLEKLFKKYMALNSAKLPKLKDLRKSKPY